MTGMNVSFKAILRNHYNINEINNNGSITPKKKAFVEFQPVSDYDKDCLDKLGELWFDPKEFFASSIAMDFSNFFVNEDLSARFFGLVNLKNNYEKIKPEDVYAIMETAKDKDNINVVEYIQGAPENLFTNPYRTIKGCGMAMIKSLQEFIYPHEKIYLDSLESAVPFYEKLGFVKMSPKKRRMLYDPKQINQTLKHFA